MNDIELIYMHLLKLRYERTDFDEVKRRIDEMLEFEIFKQIDKEQLTKGEE